MIDIEALLAKTDAFVNTMHAVRDVFDLVPAKEHIGTCINYVDLQEMRTEFVAELVNTAITYVYSPARQQQLCAELVAAGRDESAAWIALLRRSRSKFRPGNLRGQFSELLLFNLLQHYFRAAPLIRKMPITTNPALERNGADAIHVAVVNGQYRLYIGEAKTYARKKDSLKDALTDGIKDVLDHYLQHRNELSLYTFEDFLPPELEAVARSYQDGTLHGVEVHLVCIATYEEDRPIVGNDRDALLQCTIEAIRAETSRVKNASVFARIPTPILPRLSYILFPTKRMDELITAFETELGV